MSLVTFQPWSRFQATECVGRHPYAVRMTTDSTETAAGVSPLMSLSPSRASDFMTCPLLYRFRVVDRIPEPPSAAATRGTVLHLVLERLFDLPADERTLPQAQSMVESAWQSVLEEDERLADILQNPEARAEADTWLDGADELLASYFTLEDPTRLEPAEREYGLSVELPSGLTLRGYIDRLDVAPDGAIRIVDYKTGRSPTQGFEQRALFQMRFYALALWRDRGEVPRLLQLIYLGNNEVISYQPDVADLEATQRKIEALWAAIRRAYEQADWRPKTSRLCDWCSHKQRCPEWGGVLPPLPIAESPADTDDRPTAETSVVDL
jgi:putative RecB family exonuclease